MVFIFIAQIFYSYFIYTLKLIQRHIRSTHEERIYGQLERDLMAKFEFTTIGVLFH